MKSKKTKELLIKKFGFYDVTAELPSGLMEKKAILVTPIQQKSDEDIFNKSGEISPGNNIKESIPKGIILLNKEPEKKVGNAQNVLQKNNQKKKVLFSGLLEPPKPAVNKTNKAPMILTDFEDYTETFLNKAPSITISGEKGENKVEKERMGSIQEQPNQIANSMLDFDESNNLISPKDLTPANINTVQEQNIIQDVSSPEEFIDLPFNSLSEKHKIKNAWILEEIRKKEEEELKESEKQKISLASPSESKKKPEEGLISLKKKINEFPQETPEALPEEKFIIRMGEIAIESKLDVQPRKNVMNEKPALTVNIMLNTQPYKMKLVIIPTEWPVEIPVAEFGEDKSEVQSTYNESRRDSSVVVAGNLPDISSAISKNSKGSLKARRRYSRTTKRKPTTRRRKSTKEILDDSASKVSHSTKRRV